MIRPLLRVVSFTLIPGALAAQTDSLAPVRFNWTTVHVALVPDTAVGVTWWIFSSRIHYSGKQFQYSEHFDPQRVAAWASSADSMLEDDLPESDTLLAAAPTLVSRDGGLLGWQRPRVGEKWASRAYLVYYPRPESLAVANEPIQLDLALPDAREFMHQFLREAKVSRYAPDAARSAVIEADQTQEKPALVSGPPPVYPEILRQDSVEGDVWLQVIVDTTGQPEPRTLKILMAEDSLFGVEASRIVLGSRFKPARVDGKAVRVLVLLPVKFTLRRH